jgi:hypothetical protein
VAIILTTPVTFEPLTRLAVKGAERLTPAGMLVMVASKRVPLSANPAAARLPRPDMLGNAALKNPVSLPGLKVPGVF